MPTPSQATVLILGSVLAQAAVFAADANGNPTGAPLTPDGPFVFSIADPTIASLSESGNNDALVTGVAAGNTTIQADCTVGSVPAVPIVGQIAVTASATGPGFVTTITFLTPSAPAPAPVPTPTPTPPAAAPASGG